MQSLSVSMSVQANHSNFLRLPIHHDYNLLAADSYTVHNDYYHKNGNKMSFNNSCRGIFPFIFSASIGPTTHKVLASGNGPE